MVLQLDCKGTDTDGTDSNGTPYGKCSQLIKVGSPSNQSLIKEMAAVHATAVIFVLCEDIQRRLNSRLATRPTTTSPTAAAVAG